MPGYLSSRFFFIAAQPKVPLSPRREGVKGEVAPPTYLTDTIFSVAVNAVVRRKPDNALAYLTSGSMSNLPCEDGLLNVLQVTILRRE